MADYAGAISLSQAHTSDDEDSEQSPRSRASPILAAGRSGGSGGRSTSSNKLMMVSSSSNKKPRGRPPGSKNKPKPPIVITRDSDAAMKPVILEVAAGSDLVETVVEYARRHCVGISLLSGTGSVSNITLRHPMTHAPTLSLHGTYHLLCLCGSYLSSSAAKPNSSAATFGLTVAGQQGQVFGGIVAGNVVAATKVVVVAATFVNPVHHRLPVMDGSEEGGDQQPQQQEEDHQSRSLAGDEQCCGGGSSSSPATAPGMSVAAPYSIAAPTPISCQISPDVNVMSWAPRPAPY